MINYLYGAGKCSVNFTALDTALGEVIRPLDAANNI